MTKITLPCLVATALILAFTTPVFATSNKPQTIERWTRAELMLAGYREHQNRGTLDKYNDPYSEECQDWDTNRCEPTRGR